MMQRFMKVIEMLPNKGKHLILYNKLKNFSTKIKYLILNIFFRHKEVEKDRTALERDIRLEKENLFKQTQELFKFRESEANLYGEI